MHNLSPADEMCALTVRSEMNIRSAISVLVYPSAARTTASRSRSRQSVEHGASLVPARLRLLHVQIVDELPLAGWIELRQTVAHIGGCGG